MKNSIPLVREFMQVFGQETPAKLIIPDPEVRKLRARLILEEALETIEALGISLMDRDSPYTVGVDNYDFEDNKAYNPINLLDGLCDLEYVGPAGTALACGMPEEMMDEAFAEVHRSNMSKLWTTDEIKAEAAPNTNITEHSVVALLDKNLIAKNVYVLSPECRTWLVKDKGGKAIKSPSFSPPDLERIIKKYA